MNSRLPRQARQAFLWGRSSGRSSALQATSDMVDQLQTQLAIERACTAELKREVDWLLQQLGEARAALDDKSLLIRLVGTPCSATVH